MVLDRRVDFQVRDAKTGDDLTRSILLQIILEEETGGVPMFRSPMLAQIIRFYGNAQQGDHGHVPRAERADVPRDPEEAAGPGARVYGDKMMLTPELWKQFMQMQAPAMQGMMGNYLEQSAKLFMHMQERMQNQADAACSRAFPSFVAAAKR